MYIIVEIKNWEKVNDIGFNTPRQAKQFMRANKINKKNFEIKWK